MKKHLLPLILGLAGVFAIATAFGTGDEPLDEPEDDGVVLGEEDLAERGEILRNQFRRMTPGDEPLVQDIGTWPAAWEEFGTNWDSAAADREYGAWVVPVELTQENGATVMKDGEGNELWRGTTDFARPESSDVVLTGGLVAEEDWIAYEAVRGAVEEMTADASRVDIPVPMRSHPTNGLRFTSCAWTTNDGFHMELAYEVDTNVDLFVYAVAHTSALVVATWTNDENVAITDTNTVWYSVGEPFNGRDSTWEYLDTVAIDNGEAEYEDSGFPAGLGRLRYYAAAVAQDSDGDGLSDGQEAFAWHTDPLDDDSDRDGLDDWEEIEVYGTNPTNVDTDGDGLFDGQEITMGLDPTDPDMDDDGLNDGEEVSLGTFPDDPDSDDDGLPDGWEVENDLNPLSATGDDGADGDLDGDGFSNALEFELNAPANNAAWSANELAWKLTHFTSTVTTIGDVVTTNWTGLRVEVEDSLDCGGTNNCVQNETTDLPVPALLDFGYYVELVITGSVEDVDASYDKVSVEIVTANGITTNDFFSSHNGIPDGQTEICQMVDESATNTILIVPNSTVKLRYNTVGHKWHYGAYAEVTSAVVTAPLLGGFELVRERNAPCNQAPNPKQHVHTNRLYVATEASGQVELDVIPVIPPEISGAPVLCAVYEGNTHLASASPGADGVVALSFTPAAIVQTNNIWFGIDVNANGILETSEFRATTNSLDVLSFTHAHYTNRLDFLSGRARRAVIGQYYDVGATLLYTYLNRLTNAPLSYDSTTSKTVNCFSLPSLTHNAGAAFESSGNATLTVHAWNSASEASTKISKSAETRERIGEILTNHAAEVIAFFETYPNVDEHSWTWTTNDVPVNFANDNWWGTDEYDLHVSFGNVVMSHITVGVIVKKRSSNNKLYIHQLTLNGYFEDLYDFNFEQGRLNTDGAVLQLGWDTNHPARDAGHIFFDQVDFGYVFSSSLLQDAWPFNYEGMNNETNAIPTP